jgi:hypothetical protein
LNDTRLVSAYSLTRPPDDSDSTDLSSTTLAISSVTAASFASSTTLVPADPSRLRRSSVTIGCGAGDRIWIVGNA